jgi:hypothetical protein
MVKKFELVKNEEPAMMIVIHERTTVSSFVSVRDWAGGRLRRALHYNNVRLNSAIGYITPKDMLAGRQKEMHAERDRKLEPARQQRQIRRQHAA